MSWLNPWIKRGSLFILFGKETVRQKCWMACRRPFRHIFPSQALNLGLLTQIHTAPTPGACFGNRINPYPTHKANWVVFGFSFLLAVTLTLPRDRDPRYPCDVIDTPCVEIEEWHSYWTQLWREPGRLHGITPCIIVQCCLQNRAVECYAASVLKFLVIYWTRGSSFSIFHWTLQIR